MSAITFRRLIRAATLLAHVRISEMRFRWHQRWREHHDERALRHTEAMAKELQRRADLCARYGSRPGPPAPRSGSGVPLVPLPSHLVADTAPGTPTTVPSDGYAVPCPEGDGIGGLIGMKEDANPV